MSLVLFLKHSNAPGLACTFLLILLLLPAVACDLFDDDEDERDNPEIYWWYSQLTEGSYSVSYVNGHSPEDEGNILAITAELRRSPAELVLTFADGTIRTLSFSSRPKDQWHVECYCESSGVLGEVADLSPAPLQIESFNCSTPLIYAGCNSTRMILSESTDGNSDRLAIVFDLIH